MVSGNGFSFFPYFSSCLSLPLQCFQAVTLGFPLEGKTWLFAFCLSSMNELAGGGEGGCLGRGGMWFSFGLTLLWWEVKI